MLPTLHEKFGLWSDYEKTHSLAKDKKYDYEILKRWSLAVHPNESLFRRRNSVASQAVDEVAGNVGKDCLVSWARYVAETVPKPRTTVYNILQKVLRYYIYKLSFCNSFYHMILVVHNPLNYSLLCGRLPNRIFKKYYVDGWGISIWIERLTRIFVVFGLE